MKKKVLVIGLGKLKNYGENFLIDCAMDAVNETGGFEAEEADLEPGMNAFQKLMYYGLVFIARQKPDSPFMNRLEYKAVGIRCRKYYEQKMKGKAAVIIGAGSFKYGTQKLWAEYSVLAEAAAKYNIPVMFNAMNVQKYSEKSRKCAYLAEHAGYPNVKTITTRDGQTGAERLRRDYQVPETTAVGMVGDMAYRIPECYKIGDIKKEEIIGINLIDGDVFKRYGGSLTEERLLDFYCGILRGLDEKGLKWKLFINGLEKDRQFGEKVLEKYGDPAAGIYDPGSAKELAAFIGSCKAVMGARLHACICAYALDIPFAGFCWDEKMDRFAQNSRTEDLFLTEDQMNGAAMTEKLEKLYRDGFAFDRENRNKQKEESMKYIRTFLLENT